MRRGFDQRRFLLSVDFPLPLHPGQVILEVLGRFALFVQGEVLVVQLCVGVIEVGEVLPMMLGGGVVFVGALVLIVHPAVEQPIGDDTLFLALDDVAFGREEATLAIGIGVRLLGLPPFTHVPPIDGPEKVPVFPEPRVLGAQCFDDVANLPDIRARIAGVDPRCQ